MPPVFVAPLAPSLPSSHSSPSTATSPARPPRLPLIPNMVLQNSPVPPSPLPHQPSPSATPTSPAPDPISETLTLLHSSPLVLCIRFDSPTLALSAASAALRGGIRCVEVALTTPSAASIIRSLSTSFPSACIGAGTVLTPSDVASSADAGARFALSPVTDPHLIPAIHAAGMLAVPGAATPTEVHNAHIAGARLVKVFPVNLLGGVAFVKALQGPLGHIPLLPTNGVDEQGLTEYLRHSNVWCVGASRQILPKDALQKGEWTEIEERARRWAGIAEELAAQRGGDR